jgi:hypothetical protein
MTLARETGGRAIFNTNDLTEGFAGVLEENRGYYLLGYNPGEEAVGRPHNIQVKVRRSLQQAGMRVQARRTAYATGIGAKGAVSRAELGDVLNSPLAFRDVKLSLTPLFLSPDGVNARVISLLNIDLSQVEKTMTSEDGSQSINLDVVGQVTAPDGKVIYRKARNYPLNIPRADFARLLNRGIDYWFDIDAQMPGHYQVRVAVRDAKSGRTGNASRVIEVADLSHGSLSASSLLLSRTNAEGSAVSPGTSTSTQSISPAPSDSPAPATPSTLSVLPAPPTSSTSPTPPASPPSPPSPPSPSPLAPPTSPVPSGAEDLSAYSRREFPMGGTLRYQFYVYNAQRRSSRGQPNSSTEQQAQAATNVIIEVVIKRDGVTQASTPARLVSNIVTDTVSNIVSDAGSTNAANSVISTGFASAANTPILVGGDVTLGTLPPGTYTLEITITDTLSKAARTVISTDFQILK